jgi:hypothetical protein
MISNSFSCKGGYVLAHAFAACIIIFTVFAGGIAHAAAPMVWSQVDGGEVNVYFSPDGQRVLSITSSGLNVSPNLYRAADSTWITWVDKSDPEVSRLRFTRLSDRGEVMETASLPTQNAGIYSPAISVDPSGSRVWLVWVEYNGQRENLFASYRDIRSKRAGNWKAPQQITPDSKYSANLPTITSSQLDRIEVNWMRTSPDSSESATAQVLATNWLPQAAILSGNQIVKQSKREKYKSLSVSNKKGFGSYIKQLKSGQVLSTDEQQWKNMVRNKDVIMGAIHSGAGASKRVVEEFK